MQLILSLCVSKKIGNFIRVSVEVGDYKKNRADWLENLAMQTKEQAIAEKLITTYDVSIDVLVKRISKEIEKGMISIP